MNDRYDFHSFTTGYNSYRKPVNEVKEPNYRLFKICSVGFFVISVSLLATGLFRIFMI